MFVHLHASITHSLLSDHHVWCYTRSQLHSPKLYFCAFFNLEHARKPIIWVLKEPVRAKLEAILLLDASFDSVENRSVGVGTYQEFVHGSVGILTYCLLPICTFLLAVVCFVFTKRKIAFFPDFQSRVPGGGLDFWGRIVEQWTGFRLAWFFAFTPVYRSTAEGEWRGILKSEEKWRRSTVAEKCIYVSNEGRTDADPTEENGRGGGRGGDWRQRFSSVE